jgi:2-polyprenyl-6-methoxyphenol hydroxylase-like FAD-dependent oxidoreductase
MAESKVKCNIDTPRPVLIIGAGVVGLTLAQGCREAGIPFQIFEQQEASTERSQGWGLTLHWSLNSLERTIGPELSARLFTEVSPSRRYSLAKQY